ncbi:MAG: hypothetical protein IPG64_13740 [Haliea sp.]|nr:hypothetical protein [Haliea sp.]
MTSMTRARLSLSRPTGAAHREHRLRLPQRPKAHEFRDSPDRITQPMKRVNGELVAISRAQALSEIGSAPKRIHGAHGGDAIGLYPGNPISMSFPAAAAVHCVRQGVWFQQAVPHRLAGL